MRSLSNVLGLAIVWIAATVIVATYIGIVGAIAVRVARWFL